MAVSDEFTSTIGHYEDGRSMLSERIWDAWCDMDDSTRRRLAAKPTEARLLFYVLMSDMIFFLSWSLKAVVTPAAGGPERLPIEVGFWLIFAFFCRTSVIYLLAIVIGSGARILGGTGTWRDTRTAVFWGALVAAPFGFYFAVISAVLSSLAPRVPMLGEDWIALSPYWLSMIPFVYFISAGLRRAHGFQSEWKVFAILSSIAVAGIGFAMYLGSQSVS